MLLLLHSSIVGTVACLPFEDASQRSLCNTQKSNPGLSSPFLPLLLPGQRSDTPHAEQGSKSFIHTSLFHLHRELRKSWLIVFLKEIFGRFRFECGSFLLSWRNFIFSAKWLNGPPAEELNCPPHVCESRDRTFLAIFIFFGGLGVLPIRISVRLG